MKFFLKSRDAIFTKVDNKRVKRDDFFWSSALVDVTLDWDVTRMLQRISWS